MKAGLRALNLELALLIGLIVFSFIVRIIHVNFPPYFTFDEIYRVGRAEKFLNGEVFFTAHPHFGRYLIILGILVFGDNPFGWRMTQVICGTLLIPVSYLIAKKIFKYKYAGLLTAFFVALDNSYLVYSRIGVVTIYQIFFMALSLLFFILSIEKDCKYPKSYWFLSAITVGLTIAIKWTGLALLPILWLYTKTKENIKDTVAQRLSYKILFVTIVMLTYLLTFAGEGKNYEYLHRKYGIDNRNFLCSIISWHKLAFNVHAKKEGFHPSSSKWYTWPVLYKPVLIYWKYNTLKGQLTSIFSLGNPVIRWGGLVALLFQLFLLYFKRNKTMIFLVGSYLIAFLPFVFIKRPMFLYHYLPSFFFLILILEYTVATLYQNKATLRPILISMLCLTVGMFFYFYPMTNGYPLSVSEYNKRLWFDSWKKYEISSSTEAFIKVKPTGEMLTTPNSN